MAPPPEYAEAWSRAPVIADLSEEARCYALPPRFGTRLKVGNHNFTSHGNPDASRLANDDRDEDRGGPSGFEDRAARARLFAAETGLQAYTLLAAAEGAVSAYAHITGEDWKPYEPSRPNSERVSRQSTAAEMAAFGG